MGEPTEGAPTEIIPTQEVKNFNFQDFKAKVGDAIDNHNAKLDEKGIAHDPETDAMYQEVVVVLGSMNRFHCSTEADFKARLLEVKKSGSISESAYNFIIGHLE